MVCMHVLAKEPSFSAHMWVTTKTLFCVCHFFHTTGKRQPCERSSFCRRERERALPTRRQHCRVLSGRATSRGRCFTTWCKAWMKSTGDGGHGLRGYGVMGLRAGEAVDHFGALLQPPGFLSCSAQHDPCCEADSKHNKQTSCASQMLGQLLCMGGSRPCRLGPTL